MADPRRLVRPGSAIWIGVVALAAICSLQLPSNALGQGASVDVIPKPHSTQLTAQAAVWVRSGTPILVGARDSSALAVARWLAELTKRSRGLRLVPTEAARAHSPAIVLRREPESDQGEGYRLAIGDGRILITAHSDAGLLYGAVTVWQLMTPDSGHGPIRLAAVRIDDQPRFAWRGLLLDSARHFQSAAFIERMIDWMALHKLNVLQWHLTDDQGWRLPIAAYPRLTGVGGWRSPARIGPRPVSTKSEPKLYGGAYTLAEIRAIVAHAKLRNVTIVPEIEMPGHALSALLAYPELSAGPPPPRAMQSDWGLIPDAFGVDDEVFVALDQVLAQVMDLFPGRFIDIGGDEVPLQVWKASPAVQARMKVLGLADESSLQNYFIRRIDAFLTAHGRRMIGWEEILQGGTLPPEAAIESWRGAASALTAAKSGHDVVLAVAPTLYFDNRQSDLAGEPPGRGWVISLHDVYAFDPGSPPLPPAAPTPAPSGAVAAPEPAMTFSDTDRAHILGLQGNLWTEHIRTEDRLEKMMFPRAAAVAEAGWSAQSDRDWQDFLARLPAEIARFDRLGLVEDESAFSLEAKVTVLDTSAAKVELLSQTGFGQIHYALGDNPPGPSSALYSVPLTVPLPTRVQAASFAGGRRISPILDRRLTVAVARERVSQELTLCPGTLPLNLEAQAATKRGLRPVFLIEIMNPCWTWANVDLSKVGAVRLHVVATANNLQLGAEAAKVVHRPADSANGDFQIRLGDCDTGELLAVAPLRPGATELELTAAVPPRSGVHDLCFAFAGDPKSDAIWGIDKVELVPPGGRDSSGDHG